MVILPPLGRVTQCESPFCELLGRRREHYNVPNVQTGRTRASSLLSVCSTSMGKGERNDSRGAEDQRALCKRQYVCYHSGLASLHAFGITAIGSTTVVFVAVPAAFHGEQTVQLSHTIILILLILLYNEYMTHVLEHG